MGIESGEAESAKRAERAKKNEQHRTIRASHLHRECLTSRTSGIDESAISRSESVVEESTGKLERAEP